MTNLFLKYFSTRTSIDKVVQRFEMLEERFEILSIITILL